jgi:Nucleotidyl transferase AbiEii toxin, Type IV TA system
VDAFIGLGTERQRQLCEAAGDSMGLDAASIEKDFWVCWTLKELFALKNSGPHLTFKGGTSLSKGWKLIDRFSEDIDVVLERDFLGFGGDHAPQQIGISSNERNRRLEELKATCRTYIRRNLEPELRIAFQNKFQKNLNWNLSNDPDDADGQTILFDYPSAFKAGKYLRPVVKIELGARSDTDPAAMPAIESYLAQALPGAVASEPFKIRTLAPERTFWEKAMLLHEETYRSSEGPKGRLARHYYDLWCLISRGVAEKAAADLDLFKRVAAHRVVFFRKKKEAQETLRPGTIRILPTADHRAAWKKDYEAMRETMFFGETPEFEVILDVVSKFEKKFNGVSPK